ncbi:MAG TPA: signal peptidase I [Candidatus Hydrogenedentes bacterium]|jgi:signal peptidase I|nr:signal peptidase I [Candidatus Hydrogenedentota bacterium]MDY0031366.1 signal peptidase I [FCB group bacterium]NLT61761.1 signal peptidase I [Candidatus Hydrogenedentota bacterium]HNZ16746.1 signal peptidase I [Candidatus Hydrogenedentota bacterium]HOH32175.1 signal peptidase I [Candidatus Hydrogenedentota bacterium]
MADSTGNRQSAEGTRGMFGRLQDAITFVTGPWTKENGKAWLKVVVVVLLIRWLWFEPFSIPSGSMEPTLHGDAKFLKGDRVAVNKLAYGPRVPFSNMRLIDLGDPERWDIVVFITPEADAVHKVLIKRVAGLPGERVSISNGLLHVNGEPVPFPPDMPEGMRYTNELEELERGARRYVSSEHMRYGVLPQDEYSLIPEGHYLVLGDNSARSRDGRYFGWVPEENIVGRAFCIWWPWSHRRDFTGFSRAWWGKGILYGIPMAFLLYGLVTGFVVMSLRVRHGQVTGLPARGERVLVNRLMTGLRMPFTNARLLPGRLPRRGELIAYAAEDGDGAAPQMHLGRVVGTPGQAVTRKDGTCCIDGHAVGLLAEDGKFKPGRVPDDGVVVVVDAATAAPSGPPVAWVSREDMIGNVVSVWWPLHRARAVGVVTEPPDGAG